MWTRRRMVQSLLAAGAGSVAGPLRVVAQGLGAGGFEPPEGETLQAACERLFPGARQAGVLEYLGYWLVREPFRATEREFRLGARHLDRLARQRHGKGFASLRELEQDDILRHLQGGGVQAKNFDGAGFFIRLLSFTVEAIFCDSRYGGNRGVGDALSGRHGCLWNPVPGIASRSGDLPEE